MLLNIYLGTTAISWLTLLMVNVAFAGRVKREGYKLINPKISFQEKILLHASNVFKMSIPVYNILNAIVIMYMGDKVLDHLEEELLSRGLLYKPNKESESIEPAKTTEQSEKENKESLEKNNVEVNHEYEMTEPERENDYYYEETISNNESLSRNFEQGAVLKKTRIPKKNSISRRKKN